MTLFAPLTRGEASKIFASGGLVFGVHTGHGGRGPALALPIRQSA